MKESSITCDGTSIACDGSCMGPFIKALREQFGKEVEIPLAFRTDGRSMFTVVVVTKEGRRNKRTHVVLPFCGVCGKPSS